MGNGELRILQVPSDHPIGDEESVRRFIEIRLAPVVQIQEWNAEYETYSLPDPEVVRAVAIRHNADGEYADSVVEALDLIMQDPPIKVPPPPDKR